MKKTPYYKQHEILTEFAASVGNAMIVWQSIEVQIWGFFVSVIGLERSEVAFTIWSAFRHIRTQYNVTNQLMMIHLKDDPKNRKKWEALSGRINIAIKNRNLLAHGTTAISDDDDGNPIPELITEFIALLAGKARHKPITKSQVDRIGNQYSSLKRSLEIFFLQLFPPTHDT